jgi:Raf kinase inhibitor-like YbhB/YbcL family protein
MYDPDAPTGSGWWHWTVVNIPAATTELAQNAGSGGTLPDGALQTRTDFGKPGYGGPCPPPGKPHHYTFTVFALKEPVKLDADASGAMAGFFIKQAAIGSAKLTATFGR